MLRFFFGVEVEFTCQNAYSANITFHVFFYSFFWSGSRIHLWLMVMVIAALFSGNETLTMQQTVVSCVVKVYTRQ